MNTKSLICPNCGAPIKPADGSRKVECEYCGHVVVLESEEDRKKRLRELAYEREKAKHQVEDERQKAGRARKMKTRLIVIGIILAIVVGSAMYTQYSKPACDPSRYMTVVFTGVDGEGRAEVRTASADGIDANAIDYDLSSDWDLSEGDVITVTASSERYRLTTRSWQVTVTGLDLYLSDLDSLSDEMIALIHKKTDEINDRNLHGFSGLRDVNQVLSLEHVAFYLATDGSRNNILHDVSKLVVTTYEGEDMTVYISSYYEDIWVRDEEEKSFNYEKCMYCGNQVWLGQNTLHSSLIDGFESLDSVETHCRTSMESNMKLQIRELDAE